LNSQSAPTFIGALFVYRRGLTIFRLLPHHVPAGIRFGMSFAKLTGVEQTSDWLRPSVVALLLANLIPVLGVLVLGWEVFPLLLLFWFENVILGALNVLKMLLASPANPINWAAKIFIIPFFCVHYGMFTFVHGVFVVGLFGGAFKPGARFPTAETFWQAAQENHLGWAILGLSVSHAVSFATNYLGRAEYRQASLPMLMQQPYGRIVVLHLTILGGGFLMMALHSPTVGLVLLVALKTALDLRGHLKERKKFSAPLPPAAV
jgi:hypothetical protein